MALLTRPRPPHPVAAALRLFLLVLVVPLFAAAVAATGDDEALALERRIKAAFLYKFAAYVEWPALAFEHPDDAIIIGVVGAEAVADELEQLVAGRRVGGRLLIVRRIPHADPQATAHILFVGRGVDPAPALDLLSRTAGQPVLTVSEADGGLPPGSVINFMIVDDKVRFEISAAAAERNGLRLGSQLLAVARRVRMPSR